MSGLSGMDLEKRRWREGRRGARAVVGGGGAHRQLEVGERQVLIQGDILGPDPVLDPRHRRAGPTRAPRVKRPACISRVRRSRQFTSGRAPWGCSTTFRRRRGRRRRPRPRLNRPPNPMPSARRRPRRSERPREVDHATALTKIAAHIGNPAKFKKAAQLALALMRGGTLERRHGKALFAVLTNAMEPTPRRANDPGSGSSTASSSTPRRRARGRGAQRQAQGEAGGVDAPRPRGQRRAHGR